MLAGGMINKITDKGGVRNTITVVFNCLISHYLFTLAFHVSQAKI